MAPTGSNTQGGRKGQLRKLHPRRNRLGSRDDRRRTGSGSHPASKPRLPRKPFRRCTWGGKGPKHIRLGWGKDPRRNRCGRNLESRVGDFEAHRFPGSLRAENPALPAAYGRRLRRLVVTLLGAAALPAGTLPAAWYYSRPHVQALPSLTPGKRYQFQMAECLRPSRHIGQPGEKHPKVCSGIEKQLSR